MSRLGGHFAGILRVEVPAAQEQALVQSLKGLESEGLTVVVHSDRPQADFEKRELSVLEIVGQDRPGIIRQISSVLASHGINVEMLETERGNAAMSGEMLFKATATLHIPETSNIAALRKQLEKIAEDLIVDITLEEPVTK